MDAPGELPRLVSRLAEKELQDPSASRALRATTAFMVPLVLAALGLISGTQAALAAFAGHAIGGLDVRGAYALRLSLLLGISLVLTGAAWLGAAVDGSLGLAVAAAGLIALGAGAWRHGLGEYGPAVAASGALLFFIALAAPRAEASPYLAAQATLAGCLLCVLFHAAFWPFLAQHPLRRAVAGSWTALADLAAALPPVDGVAQFRRQDQVMACEHRLRAALDQATQVLAGVRGRNTRPLIRELEALNLAAADLATQMTALNPSLERLMRPPGPGPLAASFRSVLAALVNTSRSLALAVVGHQAGHLARFEVRLMRLTDLLRLLRERTAAKLGDSPEGVHLAEVLTAVQDQLPRVRTVLRTAMERASERGPVSFELFDLETWTLRPLASALNFSLRVDPALVRFSFRLAVMMMTGTAVWRYWHLAHGYWIPLCVMVVLQPDYGATRARATQRALGTIGGGLMGSLLLWLHLPLWLLLAATAAVCWAFTYALKRDYAVAVFFITILVVLQFETAGPVSVALTFQRLGLTLAGCVMALMAALTFWPMWERDRFPPLLAEAVRANRTFLERLCRGLAQAPGVTPSLVTQAKRRAQRANSLVFSSLNRMAGDPRLQQEGIERSAVLANHNLRILRGLSVAAVHCTAGAPPILGLEPMARAAGGALTSLAAVVEGADPAALASARTDLEASALPEAPDPRTAYVTAQLEQVSTELSAMLLPPDAP
jgi:uncharacterized membrane protein YccC